MNAPPQDRKRSGVVLATVLVVMTTLCIAVGLVTAFAARSLRVTRRTLDAQRAFVVAESGLGDGVMRVRNMLAAERIGGFLQHYGSISATESPDPEFELRVKVVLGDGTGSHGAVDSSTQYITVFAGARNLESGVSCALKQTLLAKGTQLSDYAAFYDGDFEACPGNDGGMAFKGKIHSNGDFYITKEATFYRNLSCVGSFFFKRKNTGLDDAQDRQHYRKVNIRYGDDNQLEEDEKDAGAMKNVWDGTRYVDSSLGDEWSSSGSALYYGGAVQTGSDGITRLDPPISVNDGNHRLIEPPVTPETATEANPYNPETEAEKFANKAALYIHVYSDGTYQVLDNLHGGVDITGDVPLAQRKVGPEQWVNLGLCNPGAADREGIHLYRKDEKDSRGGYILENDGAIETENYFADNRIQWVMKPTDLYLDKLLEPGSKTRQILDEATGGDGGIDKIIYVETDDDCETLPIVWKNWQRANEWYPATTDEDGTGVPTANRVGRNYKTEGFNYLVGTSAWIRPLPCVRVRNGADLKGCDISIVTSRHLYVEGMFNTTTKDGRGGDTWDDTLSTDDIPSAMLAGDTITALSKSFDSRRYEPHLSKKQDLSNGKAVPLYEWDPEFARLEKNQTGQNGGGKNVDWIVCHARSWQEDENGNLSYFNALRRGDATDTTYNAVFMLGIMPSLTPDESGLADVDGYYSGGLENIFRWLENWKDHNMGFNGALLCLYSQQEPEYRWRSAISSGRPGVGRALYCYDPSNKNWAFARMTPPGMPNFFSISEYEWARVPWSSVDWDD